MRWKFEICDASNAAFVLLFGRLGCSLFALIRARRLSFKKPDRGFKLSALKRRLFCFAIFQRNTWYNIHHNIDRKNISNVTVVKVFHFIEFINDTYIIIGSEKAHYDFPLLSLFELGVIYSEKGIKKYGIWASFLL